MGLEHIYDGFNCFYIFYHKGFQRRLGTEYFQYLVKWKGQPSEDAAWMTKMDISKYNVNTEDLLKTYFLPWEYDGGASSQDYLLD